MRPLQDRQGLALQENERMKMKYNNLNAKQRFDLSNWLAKQTWLKGKTLQEIADVATTGMGFKVTITNVKSSAVVIGIDVGTRKVDSSHVGEDRTWFLAKTIKGIPESLGEPVPDKLERMVNKK
jgi:hypothetical protein